MPKQIEFWDRSKRLDWFRMRALARKIAVRPALLQELADCAATAWGGDVTRIFAEAST